jgi:Kef-type K+ transport system membrane component KefB
MGLLLMAAGAGHDALPMLLAVLALVVVGARLAGALAVRLGQPAVLGELLAGLLLGNLALVGGPDLRGLLTSESLLLLAELGAVLLLFKVGLESTPREMMAVGGRALLVAVAGVVAPMVFGVGELMRGDESWMLHAFLGAMLAATSVGITARVLGDAGALQTRAARIILGAAVIDDVLGLIVLAVVTGIITAAATGVALSAAAVGWIVAKALLFLLGALLFGAFLVPRLFRAALALPAGGVSAALALGLCLLFSYLATRAGLTIGIGMMPRGEVGLIFAGIGAQLLLAGEPIVDAGTYAAAVFMVMATTMATPPLLLWSLRRAAAVSPAKAASGP